MPMIGSFADRETLLEAKNKEQKDDCIKCPKCKATWFEEVNVAQFIDEHTVILGQGLPPKNGVRFTMLRCVKCSDLLEPRILRQNRDAANQLYDNFLDQMKDPTVPTTKV